MTGGNDRGRLRRLKQLLVVATVVAVLGSTATPAAATGPYGFNGAFFYPDSTDYWYCFNASVPAGDRYRFDWAADYLDTSSVMYDIYTPTCGASTDAEFWYGSAMGQFGLAECVVQTGPFGTMCDRWRVTINANLLASPGVSVPGFYDFNVHHIVRHEIGHTMDQHHPGGVNAMSATLNVYDLNYLNYLGHELSCHVDRFLTGQPLC